jgi:hypothetical protein
MLLAGLSAQLRNADLRGLVVVIAIGLLAAPVRSDVVAQFPNPCPEGEYLDLQSSCAPLIVPAMGFDRADFLADFAPFATNVQTLSQCTEIELEAALDAVAQAGGGIVAIPACTISVSESFDVPSNTILRGSGPATRLVAVPGYLKHMIDVDISKNVVIQDMSLVGAAALGKGVVIRRSGNVLVERLSVESFGHSNVMFRNARLVTIRYIQSTNAKDFHGVESKDCTARDPEIPDEVECALTAYPFGHGSPFTVSFSVYSSYFSGNGSYGIDIHASSGEVAGNVSIGNTKAAKFPDAMNVVIHHNRFDSGLGLRFYNTYTIAGRWVRDIVLYRNEFLIPDGDYTLSGDTGTEDIYLLDNQYEPLDLRVVENPADEMYACAETEDVEIVNYTYFPSQTAPSELCTTTPLPEPSHPAMVAAALPLLALLARRRARSRLQEGSSRSSRPSAFWDRRAATSASA